MDNISLKVWSEGTGILLGGFYSDPLRWSNWIQHAWLCLESFTLVYSTCISGGLLVFSCCSTKTKISKVIYPVKRRKQEWLNWQQFFFLKCLKWQKKKKKPDYFKIFPRYTDSCTFTPQWSAMITRTFLWLTVNCVLHSSSIKQTGDWLLSRPQADVTGGEWRAAVSDRVQGRSRSEPCPGRSNRFCYKIYGPSSLSSPAKEDWDSKWSSNSTSH